MSMIPIATYTVTGSAVSSIIFSNIPSTFTHLELRSFGQDSGTTQGVLRGSYMQFNDDTGNNYFWHSLYGDGSTVTVSAATSTNAINCGDFKEAGTTAATYGVAILNILDYANTNKNKTVRTITGVDMNGSGRASLHSGAWNNTNAITKIEIKMRAGFTGSWSVGSRIDLYGILTSPATGA